MSKDEKILKDLINKYKSNKSELSNNKLTKRIDLVKIEHINYLLDYLEHSLNLIKIINL